MKPNTFVRCKDFPCSDTSRPSYIIPGVEIDPAKIKIMLISECAPVKPEDYYYAGPQALFAQTTLLAFQDAGAKVNSIQDLLNLGVYMTSAIKCGKTGYGISLETIENCSRLLDIEINLFPKVKAYLLMGDVAIKAVNLIAKRHLQPRVIPAGSTYKIRSGEYTFRGARALPSYLQAGPAFFIEKVKRKTIGEDIGKALLIAGK